MRLCGFARAKQQETKWKPEGAVSATREPLKATYDSYLLSCRLQLHAVTIFRATRRVVLSAFLCVENLGAHPGVGILRVD
jgi:hypothetical protein